MTLRGKFEHSHIVVKIILWLGCTLLFTTLALLTISFFNNPSAINTLKWIQMIQSTSMFLLPPLLMAYLWNKQPLQWLRFTNPKANHLFAAAIIMLVALPGINLLSHWNQQINLPTFLEPLEQWMKTQEEQAALITEQFLSVNTISGLIINLLLMALLPAVSEELTFRGIIQRLLEPKTPSTTPHIAIWCSAILFSAIHMQFYGFIPRMLMGALFGYMLIWTCSIWVPMLMHFLNNGTAVTLYYLSYRKGWDIEIVDNIGKNDTLWLGVVSLIITLVGIYIFRRSTTMSSASSRMSNGN